MKAFRWAQNYPEAALNGDATKVFIELPDINYPATDKLKAVEGQCFAVSFVRVE